MFYRRKVLLSLISLCGGEVEKLRLQKLLMLFCSRQEKPAYEFVPYRYGCFSFGANADLCAMEKKGLVQSSETAWKLSQDEPEGRQLLESDTVNLGLVCSKFASMETDDLIRYTYSHFPYYSLNSTIGGKLLDDEQMAAVAESVSREETPGLFTIGYEGKTLEAFLNTLLRTNIGVLCDVRKNAMSMKYGFSKKTLANACRNVGIEYCHIPEVGIESGERKELVTKKDYARLFAGYRDGVISNTKEEQKAIRELVTVENKRVALMCFEKEPKMCHRSHLAEAVINLGERLFPLTHL